MTIFGDTTLFAIEAQLERDPALRFVGNEPLGRMRVWVNGSTFGDWAEPGCPFVGVLQELQIIAVPAYSCWHRSLESMTPTERFDVLDNLLFDHAAADRVPSPLDRASFLTNSVECLDNIKGFALTPTDGAVQILVSDQESTFAGAVATKEFLSSVANQFEGWILDLRPT